MGYSALWWNTTGSGNSAFGQEALFHTTGSNNIGLGNDAGFNATTGSNNIEIGSMGLATDSGSIRIGTEKGQGATYIAGIATSQITGSAVYVSSSGQLGVLASSERYKTAIIPMGSSTDKLQRLRPVTFHLKTDPKGAVQYGLIAEEVVKVYPELVIRDEEGKIQGVRYDELAPMLLNEVQQLKARVERQDAQLQEVRQLKQQLAELRQLIGENRVARQ
jgi:trimeric autotransporter adhesin